MGKRDEAARNAVEGAVRAAFNDHPELPRDCIGSVQKRVYGQVKALLKKYRRYEIDAKTERNNIRRENQKLRKLVGLSEEETVGRAARAGEQVNTIVDILTAWQEVPEQRLGQLIANTMSGVGEPLFYIEDGELREAVQSFVEKVDSSGDANRGT